MTREKIRCPRCGSTKCRQRQIKRLQLHKQLEIRCADCGLTIRSTNRKWAIQKWMTAKEDDVAYAVPLLQSSYHNAYIGKLDLLIWRDGDLSGYLSEQTGMTVSLREPDVIDEGMVAEAR